MKTVVGSIVFGVAMAVDSESTAEANIESLMRPHVHQAYSSDKSLHAKYHGQNSNKEGDPDLKRQLGKFASPQNKLIDERFADKGKFHPEDHVPLKERNRIAAIRDDILAY